MFRNTCLCLIALSCLVLKSNASYGPINKPCHTGDVECIVATNMRTVIPYLADGIPELGIRGTEPMALHNITMDQGFFKLVFPFTKIFGSKHCNVASTKTDVLQSTMAITLDCPVQAIGKYKLTAISYVFDISNEGNFVLQSDSIRTTITSKYEKIYGNDGKQYCNLLNYDYTYEPLDKLHIELGNLFSGDIERGQFFFNFVPNNLLSSIAKIAEPVVDSAVANFHEVFKATLIRLPLF